MAKQKAVLVGMGRLQMGLIGPEFHALGYDLCLVNLGNQDVVRRTEALKRYNVAYHDRNKVFTEVPVTSCFHFDFNEPESVRESILQEIVEAKVVNFALGQSDAATKLAAEFLLELTQFRRKQAIVDHLFVCCSDNPDGAVFGVDKIQDRYIRCITRLDERSQDQIRNDIRFHVSFVQTLADRICTHRILPEEKSRAVVVQAERYGSIVFHSSFEMIEPLLFVVPEGVNVRICRNIELERKKKYFTISLAHSMCAYLGLSKGYEFIHEAIEDVEIEADVREVLNSVVECFSKRYGAEKLELKKQALDVFERLHEVSSQDKLWRVGRDVRRKIQLGDRLLGAASLILKMEYRVPKPLITTIVQALEIAFCSRVELLDDETKSFRESVFNSSNRVLSLQKKMHLSLENGVDLDLWNNLFEGISGNEKLSAVLKLK